MKTLVFILFSISVWATDNTEQANQEAGPHEAAHTETCVSLLKDMKGPVHPEKLKKVCLQAQVLPGCQSVKGTPIIHYERPGYDKAKRRILVFSLIHGDEVGAGTLVRYWMERLDDINPRNHWRIVPVLNPDGHHAKTRVNANAVDLNRNFPTKDWTDDAQKFWRIRTASNPRRFPGSTAGGEPETQCALKHIEDFKPEFVVSIHTPLGVLDFDGPRVTPPAFGYLPWRSLGHFPGSMGRYLWAERNVPVLTTELRSTLPSNFSTFDRLQDVLGQLAKYELKPPQASRPQQASTLQTTVLQPELEALIATGADH